jgi:hypothetical protein
LEFVTNPSYCEDELGIRWIVFKFLAEMTNMDIDRPVGTNIAIIPPNIFDQLTPLNGPPGVTYKKA